MNLHLFDLNLKDSEYLNLIPAKKLFNNELGGLNHKCFDSIKKSNKILEKI